MKLGSVIYKPPQSWGEKSKSISLSTPLVCSRCRSNRSPLAIAAALQRHQNTLALCQSLSREITQQENSPI